MAKHRSAISAFCRLQNARLISACNTGSSSSLQTRMNAAARLMQPLRCAATDLKTSQCLLQQASNTNRTQALARQAQRTEQPARRCGCTCTFFTRHRVTRSITTLAQPQDIEFVCMFAGAVASRRHANATQRNMRRNRPDGKHSATTKPMGGNACCWRR
jgi:hypothetical protein